MKRIFLCFILAVSAGTARAGISAGVDQTFGSSHYRGTRFKAAIDLGRTAYIAPSYSFYSSDLTSATFRSMALRLGWEWGPMSFGVDGAFQPKTDGYRRTSIGADATLSLTPGKSRNGRALAGPSSRGAGAFGAGLAGIDVGAAVARISHADDIQTPPGSHGRRLPRTTELVINQTDVSIFAGLRFFAAEFSAEATKSRYDRDLGAVNAREAQYLELSGLGSIIQGFPDTSFNAQVKWKSLPLLKPFASYTRTTFVIESAPSTAYEVGARLGLNMVTLKASYQRYRQKGFDDRNYYTLGGNFNF